MMEFWRSIIADFHTSGPAIVILGTAIFLDFCFGVMAAISREELSSSIGKAGVMRKCAMLATVLGFAVADGIFPTITIALPVIGSVSVTFAGGACMYWIVCEAISIVEKLALLGLPIRKSWLRKLKQVQSAFDADTKDK